MNATEGWYGLQAKTNPDLFRVVYDFNCRPQLWLPARVLESLPHQPVIAQLADSRYGAPHLATWLVQELGLNEAEWDFAEPRRRLHLLGTATLERLARFCGAALVWPRIAAVIGRSEIQALKATLGEDAHAFAMRRARFIVPESDVIAPDPGEGLCAHAITVGWRMLLSAFGTTNEALRRRLALKLPPEAGSLLAAATVESDTQEQAWKRVRKISTEVLTEGELKCFV